MTTAKNSVEQIFWFWWKKILAMTILACVLVPVVAGAQDTIILKKTPEPDNAASNAAANEAAGEAAGKAANKSSDYTSQNTTRSLTEEENTGKAFNLGSLQVKGDTAISEGVQNQSYRNSTNPAANFIIKIINFIAYTIGSLALLGIVVGGFMMIASAGNTEQINKGKEFIKYSIFGIVITFTAFFIVAFVQNLFFETFN